MYGGVATSQLEDFKNGFKLFHKLVVVDIVVGIYKLLKGWFKRDWGLSKYGGVITERIESLKTNCIDQVCIETFWNPIHSIFVGLNPGSLLFFIILLGRKGSRNKTPSSFLESS